MTTSQITARRRRGTAAAGWLSLCLAAGSAGCDFIATEPKGQLTTEDFFKNSAQAVQATNATYSMLRDWTVHVFAWLGLTDMASDDATKGSVPADADFLLLLDNLDFRTNGLAFLDSWTGYYRGIYRANVAIENIPNVPMDAGLKARLIAENKFLRAYFYFFLVRAYGGVPLITRPLRPSEFIQPRASAATVYGLIEQDLLDAIGVLPERSQYGAADLGRATKGAARGLLAQAYLYEEKYAEALQQAQAVITSGQYSLYPDYDRLFTRAGENSSEAVFEVQSVALAEGGAGSQYSEVQGVRGTPSIGWGFNTPSDGLEAAYEPGDPRLAATILHPWELLPDGTGRVVYLNSSMPNNRYNQKVFVSPETPGGAGNGGSNIRRLRYADVLLIAAEAAYQTGNTGDAQMYLNQVRARARGGRTVTLGFTPELLATSIAVDVLGLPTGSSRVFVRYVHPGSAAHTAGLRSFMNDCAAGGCGSASVPPVRVDTLDVVQTVDGTPVVTLSDYVTAVDTKSPGTPVTLQVLRATRNAAGATTTQQLTLSVTAQALLPDVTADLLNAIWQERRVELAMEQHRWFDMIRQGRAQQLMQAVGKTFVVGKHELYPIPASEITLSGLQQNPGY